jgi:thioredoxin-dependent peroxiredoxin
MALEVGNIGPDFALPDQEGNYIKLSRLLEQHEAGVVVYFFPQADSPGCTREACGFRDQMESLNALGIGVVGVSPDAQPAEAEFARKNNLNFSVCADTDHTVATEWGTWHGAGVQRKTFVLDPKGIIRHIFQRVDVMKHAVDVLELFGGSASAPAEAPAAAPASAAAGGAPAAAPVAAAGGDLVAGVARASLQLLLAHLDAGGKLPADVADLAARVAARK